MANKEALYWSGKGRFFRRHKLDGDSNSCPKCRTSMVKRLSDIEEGSRRYVLVCSSPECLYVLVPTKVASIDLSKVTQDLGSRAQLNKIDHSMLELSHDGKKIYLNSAGEIWTSDANSLRLVTSPSHAVKELRKMMASSRISFDIIAEDLIKEGDPVLAEPVIEDTASEVIVIQMGDEIMTDLMGEPEVSDLCAEDQEELAVMVMGEILSDKRASYLKKVAFESSKLLSDTFVNMKFEPVGSKIKVSFDSKLASSDLTNEQFASFLFGEISDSDFYSKLSNKVSLIREKVAREIPDYFKIRDLLIAEIKEQKNGGR